MYQTAEGVWVHDAGEEGVREQQREYRHLERLYGGRACGPVWDVGAHVGWFGWYLYRTCRPARVLHVECAPRQLEALRRNARPEDVVYGAALVPTGYRGTSTPLYLGKTYTSCDSTWGPVRGRCRVDVPVVRPHRLSQLLPDPEVVKLDCEGAEYHLDPARHLPASVRLLMAEVHHGRPGQLDALVEWDRAVRQAGFVPVRPLVPNHYKKTTHVTYTR